jgi:hypothetical protein
MGNNEKRAKECIIDDGNLQRLEERFKPRSWGIRAVPGS